MRLLILTAVPTLTPGAILLWAFAHRTTPLYVRVTGLKVPEMEFPDGRRITTAILLRGSSEPRLVRDLAQGVYALAFALPKKQDKEEDFNIGLGYVGAHRKRPDLDLSPATIKDAWHIRLAADGTTVLFDRCIAFHDADGEHPCLIRF